MLRIACRQHNRINLKGWGWETSPSKTMQVTRVFNSLSNDVPDTILEVLMRRDNLSKAEALELIADAKQRVADGEDPEEIVHFDFGLEPDYIYDIL